MRVFVATVLFFFKLNIKTRHVIYEIVIKPMMIRNTNQAQQSEQIYVEKVSRLRRLEIMEIFKSVVEEKQRSY